MKRGAKASRDTPERGKMFVLALPPRSPYGEYGGERCDAYHIKRVKVWSVAGHSVLLVGNQPTNRQRGHKVDKTTADRMAKIFFAMASEDGDIADSDMPFFTNNLGPFTKLMNEQAVEALISKGVDEDYAHFVVGGTAILNKMWGAHSYNDFIMTERMAESLQAE